VSDVLEMGLFREWALPNEEIGKLELAPAYSQCALYVAEDMARRTIS
jgi:hypothetical protein